MRHKHLPNTGGGLRWEYARPIPLDSLPPRPYHHLKRRDCDYTFTQSFPSHKLIRCPLPSQPRRCGPQLPPPTGLNNPHIQSTPSDCLTPRFRRARGSRPRRPLP